MRKQFLFQNKSIQYTVTGQGQPVVLIHGFAEDSRIWKYQQEALQQHYRLIIPDLPGSGQSQLTETFSMELGADCIRQLLIEEKIDRAVLAGHSMGGYIVLAFAEKYPAQLVALGLIHSTAYADSPEKKAARQRGIDFIRTHGSHEFLKQSIPNLFSPESRISMGEAVQEMIATYKDFNPATLIACYQAMMERPDRTQTLQSFDKPVLFMIGKYDTAVPFDQSLRQAHLPQITYIHLLDHSGHMGPWEEKEKTNSALLSFLLDAFVIDTE